MSEVAVKTEGLGKRYVMYNKPIDRLKETFLRKKIGTDFWVFRDLSFTLNKGEFLGILGKNGAGKTTLLRMLSGELAPTEGSIQVQGTVALLQLGVGFNGELSGVENARYSAQILGISAHEFELLLPKIREFSELGEFLDRPVKTYSSGMYSRLAFSLAIHVNPDILIADEVLAVGDLRFSQKCLQVMKSFKQMGKTVILVTHDTQTVATFCDKALWLKDGRVFREGNARIVAEEFRNYMLYDKLPGFNSKHKNLQLLGTSSLGELTTLPWEAVEPGYGDFGDGRAKVTAVCLVDQQSKKELRIIKEKVDVCFYVMVEAEADLDSLHVGWLLNDELGMPALHLNNELAGKVCGKVHFGTKTVFEFQFLFPNIKDGNYVFTVSAQEQGGEYNMYFRSNFSYAIAVRKDGLLAKQAGHTTIENSRVEIKQYSI